MRSTIKIGLITDLFIILIDMDQGKSITNNAYEVVGHVNRTVPIGPRRVYYRDTMGWFDELKVKNGRFVGFSPCSDAQQSKFSELV